MIKKLVVLFFFANGSFLYAQTIKTDVLVIGGSPSGVAAAIQCARSKVKTVLAAQSIELPFKGGNVKISENRNIPSGIWGEFRKRILDLDKAAGPDTAYDAPLTFEKATAEALLQKMTDTIKDLTVDLNTSFTSIKKDGDRWEVHLLHAGRDLEVKARVVIDATEGGIVAKNARAKPAEPLDMRKVTYPSIWYRTAIASGRFWPGDNVTGNNLYPFWTIPIAAVVIWGTDNLLATESILQGAGASKVTKNAEFLPIQLELGQGAGTIAAYCAFFKTTTDNLKVRTIQGELLDFKGYLLPFADIAPSDIDWRTIQQVGATGLLKGKEGKGGFVFMPDEPVLTSEIQPVLKEIYTRAFLWFNKEKPAEKFTVSNLLSFISDYTLTDPQVLKFRIQRDWKTLYKFKTDFGLNRPVSRREFAVLANKFLNPFGRTVDLLGRLVN